MSDVPAAPGQPEPTSAASIIAAAERLASEITRGAEADADAIRARAGSDSDAARSAITERLQRLSALTDGMSERLGEMRAELDSLAASLAGVGPSEAEAPAAGVADAPAAGVAGASAAGVAGAPAAGLAETAGSADDAGARLIALNLALSGTPRDEAARQLRDQVPDSERLVDEVYASVDR